MKKFKMLIASVMLFGFGIVLAYAFPLEPTPVQMQANFISCLEQNLMNTQHDCFTRLVRQKQ